MIKQTATTCSDWLVLSPARQASLVTSVVGIVNLSLRIKGTTGSCTGSPRQLPVADVISGIATGYPTPVSIDQSKLSATLRPDDPDQCDERTQAAPGDATNESWIAAGLEDCVAMGY